MQSLKVLDQGKEEKAIDVKRFNKSQSDMGLFSQLIFAFELPN